MKLTSGGDSQCTTANLHGHAAGNGGHRQGTPKVTCAVLSYSAKGTRSYGAAHAPRPSRRADRVARFLCTDIAANAQASKWHRAEIRAAAATESDIGGAAPGRPRRQPDLTLSRDQPVSVTNKSSLQSYSIGPASSRPAIGCQSAGGGPDMRRRDFIIA